MEWTIQDLGAVGEFVGAIGVVVTLGYLAFQIRQNTFQLERNALTTKAAAVNASNVALRETRQSIFGSAEMSEFFLIGNDNPGALDEVQMLRYRLVMQNITEVMVDIYTQIGRALVRSVVEKKEGSFRVTTGRLNQPAIELYIAQGFELVGSFTTSDGVKMVELVFHPA